MNGDRISFGYMDVMSAGESCCTFYDFELHIMSRAIRWIDFNTPVRLDGVM